jgi:hypothetical protein
MDTLEYQAPETDRSRAIAIVFNIASVLAAVCGLAALAMGIYGAMAISRGSPTSISGMMAIVAMVVGVGLLVIQVLGYLKQSIELISVIGTLFAAVAFVVLPPIVEKILFAMSIPKINSTATWGQVGYMTDAALIGGFVGAAFFLKVRQLRRDIELRSIQVHVTHKELPFIPPPETEPSAQ